MMRFVRARQGRMCSVVLPCVVEYHRDWAFRDMRGQLAQQLTHGFRSHGRLVHHHKNLFGQCIDGTKHIEALAT